MIYKVNSDIVFHNPYPYVSPPPSFLLHYIQESKLIYEIEKMREDQVHDLSITCATKSYLHYHKSKYYEPIVQHLLSRTEGKWEKGVRWFVSNSARSLYKGSNGFMISLHGDYYSNNKQSIGFRGVKGLLTWLEEKGYINIYKGYVVEWSNVGGKRVVDKAIPSVLEFRNKYQMLWEGITYPYYWLKMDYDNCLELKTREKEQMSLRGKTGSTKIREEIMSYNSSLAESNILYNGKPFAKVEYKRVFIESFEGAGRLYVQGGGVQLLPQKVRSEKLTIDGEGVVELDYNAIHPSICYQLLYNQLGMNAYDLLGDDFSPYDADLSFFEVNQEQADEVGNGHNPVRNLAKDALLIAMNAVDKKQAVGGLSNKIYKDARKEKFNQRYYGIGSISSTRVFDALVEHNDLIADKFFCDYGIVLQNYDSKILLSVVDQMIQLGHTVLSYHDSFLVKQSAQDDLKKAMFIAWEQVLGNTTFCKVDKK